MHYPDSFLINKFFHFWRRVFTCSCTKTSASSIPQQLGFHQSFPWAHQGDPGTWEAKLFLKLTVPSQSESQVSFSMANKPRFSPKQQIYSLEHVFSISCDLMYIFLQVIPTVHGSPSSLILQLYLQISVLTYCDYLNLCVWCFFSALQPLTKIISKQENERTQVRQAVCWCVTFEPQC